MSDRGKCSLDHFVDRSGCVELCCARTRHARQSETLNVAQICQIHLLRPNGSPDHLSKDLVVQTKANVRLPHANTFLFEIFKLFALLNFPTTLVKTPILRVCWGRQISFIAWPLKSSTQGRNCSRENRLRAASGSFNTTHDITLCLISSKFGLA